jgi:hypothetical protein
MKKNYKMYNIKFLGLTIDNNLSWGFSTEETVPNIP